jgi:hypothetical protein
MCSKRPRTRVMRPDGLPLRAEPAGPGPVHGITAARGRAARNAPEGAAGRARLVARSLVLQQRFVISDATGVM